MRLIIPAPRLLALTFFSPAIFIGTFLLQPSQASTPGQTDRKKEEQKKKETLPIKKITQGMGLYAIGSVSPDKQWLILLAQKPGGTPNLYILNLNDLSIRPALTSFQWGVTDARWSPDGTAIVFSGANESASFSDLYRVEVKSGKLTRITSNNFSDKEPVYSPDGKSIFFTTDESPLPDAAFGIIHVARVPATGGKSEFFTEDEVSTIHPGVTPDGKGVLLVKVDEDSGRHSLWEYGMDGRPHRNITGRKFARIHSYVQNTSNGTFVVWGQEEPEQQDGVYIFDSKSGEARPLPDPDYPKRSPALSPDGKLIAFIAPTDKGSHLFVYDSTTGVNTQLTFKGTNTFGPVFVANDQIIYGTDRDKENEVYHINLTPPPPDEKKKL